MIKLKLRQGQIYKSNDWKRFYFIRNDDNPNIVHLYCINLSSDPSLKESYDLSFNSDLECFIDKLKEYGIFDNIENDQITERINKVNYKCVLID